MDFPYGEIVSEIPEDFFPPEMWPEYGHIADPAPLCRRESLDTDPPGIRWALWPLCFEEYYGEVEPDLSQADRGALAYNRLVTWKRLHRTDVPPGWHVPSQVPPRIDGFRPLTGDLTAGWHKNARRDLRMWQTSFLDKSHVIEKISYEEYAEAYAKGTVASIRRGGKTRLYALRRKLSLPHVKQNTILWGIRDLHTQSIVAGTASIFSPTRSMSTHYAPFIQAPARHLFAATALIHRWFEESQQRGMRYAMTTNFWYPGKARSWKGFSEFKSHFGFTYVAYLPDLTRFVRGKFF